MLQQGAGLTQPDPLPPLPPNARYVPHPNECYDLGTVGWVLDRQANLTSYAYIVWLNSSARGPFLPAYLRGRMHWTEPLLSKITARVKLVGATINCGGVMGPNSPDATAHVQSYVVATDATGLGVLRASGTVLRCISDKVETVLSSEIGATTAMLAAGYNVDSLMVRYQVRDEVGEASPACSVLAPGRSPRHSRVLKPLPTRAPQGVDWREATARKVRCNAAYDPVYSDGWNGGINVDPLEVMFVKVKGFQRAAGWPHVRTAIKFDEWMRLQPGGPEWLQAMATGP